MPDDNIHKGHRKRMLEKFNKFGINVFNDHEKLEVLLYSIIPRVNTNPIAHNLINKFGSLKNLLLAPLDELQQIEGIGIKAAVQLRFFGALTDHLNQTRVTIKEDFSSAERVSKFCIEHLKDKTSEVLMLLLLDDKYALLHDHDITNHMPNHITADFREIAAQVLKYNSRKLIIAHNHLNVPASPSNDDLNQTRRLGGFLREIRVEFVDHIIVSGNDSISLRKYGYLNEIWEY